MGTPDRTVLVTRRAPRPEMVPPGARVLTGHVRAAAALGVAHEAPSRHAVRLHVRAGGAVAGRLTQWRTLARAVRETVEGPDPVGVQRVLAGPVRELLRAGLDDVPGDAPLARRALDAVRVARRYRELLDEHGEIDPAEAYWAAARAARRETGPVPVLAVLGAHGLGADGSAFLDAAAGPGSVVVLPPEEEATAARLVAAGWVRREDPEGPSRVGERLARRFATAAGSAPPPAPDAPHEEARAYAFASQEQEIRWTLARVKGLLAEGVPAADVVIAARDDTAVSDRVEATAWELGVPVRAMHGVPLAETRLGGWLDGLREVVRRELPYEETARLLAHRATGGLDEATWRAVRASHPEDAAAWAELDPRAAALVWPERDVAAGWAARLDATLDAFGLLDEAALEPRDAAVLRTLREAVAEHGGAPGARRGEAPRAAFLRDLEDLLRLLTVRKDPAPGASEPAAVELVALHTLAGARVPHLFVLGAVEGGLPADLSDDPVLDFADRARLAAAGVAVEVAADRARAETAAFAALLRAADGPLTLTVPARIGGRARLPSAYLERLGLRPEPAPPLPPASVEERRARLLQHDAGDDPLDPVLGEARRAWRVERRRESTDAADAHDGVTGRPREPERRPLSATQIVELGGCPFRWFGHRILDVRDLEEVEEVVSPRLRGTLWHAALERAVRAGVEGAADDADGDAVREAVLAALPRAFAEAEAHVGVPAVPAWTKAREGELQALARAVRGADFLAEGARPLAFERSFRGRWQGLVVSGVVDRIDEGPEGLELIDYKSGSGAPRGAKGADGRGWVDVQLPLYLEAAAPELMPGRPVAAARYLSLRSGETVRTARPGANAEALAELAERVRGHLREGAYPVDPDPRREVCGTCDLAAVCRVGPRVDRMRDARRAGPATAAPEAAAAAAADGGAGRPEGSR